MAGGQQSDVSAGTLDDLRFVPLRSRKAVTGTADFALTGQSVSGAQGVFLKSKTAAPAGSAVTVQQGNVGAPIAPPAGTNFVRVTDLFENGDGPTYLYSSFSLKTNWFAPGGDWIDASGVAYGNNPYGTVLFPAEAWSQDNPGNIHTSTNIAALINEWMTNGNRGMFFRHVGGSTLYLNGRIHHWGAPPTLIAKTTTSGGAFVNCPPVCVIGLPQTSGNSVTSPQDPAQADVWNPNGCLRFNISALTGTCTEAYFSATNVNTRGDLATVHLHLLNPTELITAPEVRFASDIEPGLTATVAENALATHPNVATYFNFGSDAEWADHYNLQGSNPFGPGGHSYGTWVDLGGLNFLRGYYCSEATCERLWTFHLPFQHKTVGPHTDDNASWRRNYAENQELGYGEIYFSHYLKFDPGWATAMNEPFGLKLSGLQCTNEYVVSSGEVPPEPLGDEQWSCLIWHGTKSIEHPGFFRGNFYIYNQDHPFSSPTRGGVVPWNKHPGLGFMAGEKYHLELYVKMNTIAGNGTANFDGILRLWVNEVRVHNQTDVRWRIKPHHQVKAQLIESYHGGVGTAPLFPVYHEVGRVINATTRVGRFRASTALPADVPPPGTFAQVGTNRPMDATNSAGWANSMLANFTGGGYVEGLGGEGKFFVRGGGEHGGGLHPDEGGIIIWDVATRTYQWLNRPIGTHYEWAGEGPYSPLISPTDSFWGHYLDDGTFSTPHTYNSIQALPAGWHPSYPNGAAAQVGHYLGQAGSIPSVSPGSPGPAATAIFDLVTTTGGQLRLTGNTGNNATSLYDYIDGTGSVATRATGNDGAGAGLDYRRKGWWSRAAKNDSQGYISFTDAASGVITNYAPNQPRLVGDGYAQLAVLADEGAADNDLLVYLGGPTFGPPSTAQDTVWVSKLPWVAGSGFQQVTLINNTGISDATRSNIGFGGFRWCSHPNVQAFMAIDGYSSSPAEGANTLRVMKIKPPPPGQRFTGQWIYTCEIVTSYDGTLIRNYPVGDANNNESSLINGLHGRVVYIPHLRCLGFPMSSDRKFVFIRSSEMI